jgi:hypothetical protein
VINGTPEIMNLAVDFDEHFIQVPPPPQRVPLPKTSSAEFCILKISPQNNHS